MRKVLDTTRVPAGSSRSLGRSFSLIVDSRNIVITSAWDRSVVKRSAATKVARSATPARLAFWRDSSTRSGLYSMPCAVRPRWAAVITVRPSPEPRSISLSLGVTLAMSSILSTRAWGVGTQMTSLPSCPTSGTYSFLAFACAGAAVAPWAMAPAAWNSAIAIAEASIATRIREPVTGRRAD
ncbi:hypothetical protein D3C72_1689770 [compost metagenome]